jgi:MazG family protein
MTDSVAQLREIIARLRAPGGCPWDREQTVDSLRTSLLEEAYEVVDAIERNHQADLEEELGDLLINIVMQAEIASESAAFTLESIASVAAEKLIRRHPHVFGTKGKFGESSADSSEAVLNQWEEIKRAERLAKQAGEGDAAEISHLDGVARAFPALVRAQKIQKKAAKVGFDWVSAQDVIDKVREEIVEVEAELAEPATPLQKQRLTEEIGDLLFAVVNLSRALSIDAESSLQSATDKFTRRFLSMERQLSPGRNFAELTFQEMNDLWDQAKRAEKVRGNAVLSFEPNGQEVRAQQREDAWSGTTGRQQTK